MRCSRTVFFIRFQPTRPLRGATFSICCLCDVLPISTHAPLAGRDLLELDKRTRKKVFQPTRPLRGATGTRIDRIKTGKKDFNPRAPCGARRKESDGVQNDNQFQPTRPLRGATSRRRQHADRLQFQPTRPLRGATAKVYKSLCTFLR